MSNNDLSLIEKFKSLMQQAMLYAQYSHDYILMILLRILLLLHI